MNSSVNSSRRASLAQSDDGTAPVQADAERMGSLVSGIVEDLQGIVRGEVQLAKTEIQQDVSAVGKGIASTAAGAVIAIIGFLFLMLGLTFLINKWIELWISAVIVGAALLVIGTIAALIGKQRLSAANLKPDETIESLKEDQEWANRQVKSVTK